MGFAAHEARRRAQRPAHGARVLPRPAQPFANRWLPKLEAGSVQIQVCALFSDDVDLPELALRKALLGVGEFDRAVAENEQVIAVRSAADLDAALEPGRTGLVLAIEGMEPLGYDPGLIDVFCSLGVRMASLTWNRRNPFADGTAEGPAGGLSRIGRELVDRMAALPIAFDLAHANEGTFFEVLARSDDRPVLVSHALCRAVHDRRATSATTSCTRWPSETEWSGSWHCRS